MCRNESQIKNYSIFVFVKKISKMIKHTFLLTLALLFSIAFQAQDARKYTTHIVKEGEKLKDIAKKYDCKVKEIKDLNPDVDEENLMVNTALVVPNNKKEKENKKTETVKETTPTENQVNIHIVETGQTVYGICKKYNVTMHALREANHLTSDTLTPGQKLRIPSQSEFMVKPSEQKVEFYQVKKGDTKWRIATLYNITVSELDALNPELQGELQENQYIWVPSKEIEVKEEVKDSFQQEQDPSFIYHVVKEGEGLFRIAVLYSTTQEEIEKLNPEAVKLLRPGMLLKIPGKKKDKFVTHVVEKGDTFYNLTRKYKVSEESLLLINPELKEGLKLGTTIFIKPIGEAKNTFESPKFSNNNELKVSFLMPMMSDSTYAFGRNTNDSKLRTIVADYYLGAKMAIEELEKKGIQIDFHVYDTKNDVEVIQNLLKQNSIQESDVIIGPFFFDKAEMVAEVLKDVPVIVPLYSKKQESNHQPNLIKTGIDEKNTIDALGEYLVDYYKNQKIILISDFTVQNISDQQKLEKILKEHNVPFQNINPTKNAKNESVLYINKTSLLGGIAKEKETWVVLMSENLSVNSEVISTYGMNNNGKIRLFTNIQMKKLENINFNHLADLKWTFPAVYFDELNSKEIEAFKTKFREKNYAFPESFAFSGYDVTYDILSRIATGDLINSLDNEKSMRLTRSFDFQKTEHSDYINTGVLMYMLNADFEYELVK
jgi:LysM repeat protein/ABC-type branched-subunit amino acid transport system substrate-binding protein